MDRRRTVISTMTARRATAFPAAAAAPASSPTAHDDNNNDQKKKKTPKNKNNNGKPPCRWTNLNSDAHCLRDDAHWFRRALYAVNLHTALYMLTPRERAACYAAIVLVAVATAVVFSVFVRGMVDGFRTAEYYGAAAATSSATAAAGASSWAAGNAGAASSVWEQAQAAGSGVPKVEL